MTMGGEEISLAVAGPHHAQSIAALHGRLFRPAWDRASVLQSLSAEGAAAFVASAGAAGEPAGFVIGRLIGDEAEVLSVGVAPDWRRRGVGRTLLAVWTAHVTGSGARRVFLEVAADNAVAIAFYGGLGFRSIARRPGYYVRAAGDLCDALILSRCVGPQPAADKFAQHKISRGSQFCHTQ